MRTDEEIKEWIDSREALTKNELYEFKRGHKRYGGRDNVWLKKWWDYVLKTKDWEKLREYREHKIENWNVNTDKYKRFHEIIEEDKRLLVFGSRYLKKWLKKHYNLELARSTIQRYKNVYKETAKETL